jgi:undecaprenyl-diphosphatase
MLILQAIILGLIQGLTEFIPISSSAHLVIVPWLFKWDSPILESLTFDVALHLGTLVAILLFFASDWIKIIRAGFSSIIERKIGDNADRRLAWFLVIGSIPAAFFGFIFESKVETLFHSDPINFMSIVVMGIIIALMGLLLYVADHFSKHNRDFVKLNIKDAILIGCAQVLALFPGVSRSGSTITAGMALGFDRKSAARFSFLLSAPIIAGGGLHSLMKIFKLIHGNLIASNELVLFPIGFLTAAISGYLCIKFLMKYLQNHTVDIFVYYRFALAALIIVVALVRR